MLAGFRCQRPVVRARGWSVRGSAPVELLTTSTGIPGWQEPRIGDAGSGSTTPAGIIPVPSRTRDASVPHSSRGPGHRPLKAEIIGSNPIRGTNTTRRPEEPMLATAAPNIFFVVVLPILGLAVTGIISVGLYKVLGAVFRG